MAELVTLADRLRNKANEKKDKAGSQVSSETILNIVVKFLNDDNMDYLAVSDTFTGNKPASQIVQRFRKVIIDQQLDELVYPVEDDGTVYLSLLVERDEENETDAS